MQSPEDLIISVVVGCLCYLLLCLVVGSIPVMMGVMKKQVQLGKAGFLACVLSGILFPGLLLTVGICVVFIWLMARSAAIDVTESDRAQLRTKAVRITSLIVLALDLIYVLCLAFLVLYSAPAFREIYADFGTQLPSITRFVVSPAVPTYLLCFAIAVCALIAKEITVASKKTRLIINTLAGLGLECCIAICVIALYLPIFVLGDVIDFSS